MVNSSYFDDDQPPPYMALPAEDDDQEAEEPIRPLRSIWLVLVFAMAICVFCLIANTVFVSAYVSVANQYLNGSIGESELFAAMDKLDEEEQIGSGVYLIGLLIALLAYLWFNVRAMSNLKAFSPRYVAGSITGVVLWQFVPIVQLVKPYQLMTMYWTRSREVLGEEGKSPKSAHAWWLLWLGANLAAYLYEIERRILASQVQTGEPFDLELYCRAGYTSMISNALIVVSIFFLLSFTRGIARTQDAIRAKKLRPA